MDDEQEELLREKLQPHLEDAKANYFLNLISELESSSGKNTNHPEIESGPYAGQKGIGQYGMLPGTLRELATRSHSPDLAPMTKMDDDELKQKMSNKDLEYRMARQLTDKVLKDQNGDEDMAAYAWNSGHNLTPEQITSRDPASDPYVRKFDLIKNKLKGNK